MVRLVMAALAGGLAVWFWGDEVRRPADVLDRTKEQVSSTLQAGQDAIRPRMG